jgi:hypothetical protein
MITKPQVKILRAAIRRLVQAELDDAFKGGGDPDDYFEIERELKLAKQNLNLMLRKLQEKT